MQLITDHFFSPALHTPGFHDSSVMQRHRIRLRQIQQSETDTDQKCGYLLLLQPPQGICKALQVVQEKAAGAVGTMPYKVPYHAYQGGVGVIEVRR